MADLRRLVMSFRRQGSSGIVREDKITPEGRLDSDNKTALQQEHSSGDQKSELHRTRSESCARRGYRTIKVEQAEDPPSPKLSGCGFFSMFAWPSNVKSNIRKSKHKSTHDEHVDESRSGYCVDRISNLPDELLVHMLSFLPTRCVVSTSVLSTRWRYLFTLTNRLSFKDTSVPYGRKLMFKKFVYNVLELHQISPIKKFSLDICCTYDKSDVKAWVSTAVKKGVQDLYYRVLSREDHELPDDLFMCKTLVRLKIFSYAIYKVKIPLSTWLPRLEILDLEHVRFLDYDSLEILFSGCESLKELSLRRCQCYTEFHYILSTGLLKVLTIEYCIFREGLFEIDAPNLAYLTYTSNIGVKIIPSWKYSCSLVEAKLQFDYFEGYDPNQKALPNDRELVKVAAYKTIELHLLFNSLQLLLKVAEHEEMPVFHNLSRLYLDYIFKDAWEYVTSLIDNSPQLETVVFKEGLHYGCRDPVPPPSEALLPFSCEAKVIKIHGFNGDEVSLLHLGHLLRNSRVLKEVIVYKHYSHVKKVLQISNELLMLPRASKDCHIQLT